MAAVDHAFETVTSRSSVSRAAPPSSACCASRDAVGEVARRVRRRRAPPAALKTRDVAIGAARAVEHGAQRRRVVRGVAALQRRRVGARAGRRPRASTSKARISPSFEFDDLGRRRSWSSRRARRRHGRSRPARSRGCAALRPSARSQADENTPITCRFTPAGFDERPEQIEDRARAELDARRADVTHRGVVGRSPS